MNDAKYQQDVQIISFDTRGHDVKVDLTEGWTDLLVSGSAQVALTRAV